MGFFKNIFNQPKKKDTLDKKTKDELSKKVGKIMNQIIEAPEFDNNKFQVGIKQILLQKRQRANSNAEYFEALIRNITYLVEFREKVGLLIEEMLRNKKIMSTQITNNKVTDLRKRVNKLENLKKLMPQYEKTIQGINIKEKIQNAEAIYANAYAANNIMLYFISTFVDSYNKKAMEKYFNYPPEEVSKTVSHYCRTFGSMINGDFALGTMKNGEFSSI